MMMDDYLMCTRVDKNDSWIGFQQIEDHCVVTNATILTDFHFY